MARVPVAPPAAGAGAPPRAWSAVLGGLAATLAALVLYGMSTLDALAGLAGFLLAARLLLATAGLIAAGAGVARRLRAWDEEFDERVGAAGLLVVASLAALAACFAVAPWDSIQLFLGVLTAVALGGASLVLLPLLARKVAISLLVLAHFGNTLVATTTVPPPNAPAPFVMVNAWAHLYRYYSSFMYLNNAYHFYSPEPGPPTLVWFHLRYSDGSTRWVKVPDRAHDPIPLHYQRMLSLTESTNAPGQAPEDFETLTRQRVLYSQRFNPPIPLLQDRGAMQQYQMPADYSKVMIASYARYVARNYAHPDGEGTDPAATLTRVKVYRIVHSIISAPELARTGDPMAKTLDLPYFQGEFDAEGNLKDPKDPMLYWLIPIAAEPEREGQNTRIWNPMAPPKIKVVDYLEVHANYEPQAAPAGQEK